MLTDKLADQIWWLCNKHKKKCEKLGIKSTKICTWLSPFEDSKKVIDLYYL